MIEKFSDQPPTIHASREELSEIAQQCSAPNWDGFGALPVQPETVSNVLRFLELLPTGVSAPSVGAEPDGQLTLEWHKSARRTFSISVTPDSFLHYAALVGPNRHYGTMAMLEEIPDEILTLIERVEAA